LHERLLASQRNRHVRSTGQVEHGACVLRDLPGIDVAADARHRDELDLRRGTGIEEGERVIDARVDVEDHRDSGWHGPNPIGGRAGSAWAADPIAAPRWSSSP